MTADTTGQAPAIPDEMLILRAICDPGSFLPRDHYNGEPYGESIQRWSMRAVKHVINEWLAGRTVVDLPEPVGRYRWDWDSPAGRIEAFHHLGSPHVSVQHAGQWVADEAEKVFLAGLAAVCRSRELANEYNSAMSFGVSSVD
jgi:hypothetical protein